MTCYGDLIFSRHKPQLIVALSNVPEVSKLPAPVVEVIAGYITTREDAFGAKVWKRIFGVDLDPEKELPASFYNFWFSPDPLDSTKKVCDTHLIPVLRPSIFRMKDEKHPFFYCLKQLNQFIQNPCKGYASSTFAVESLTHTEVYDKYKETPAQPACWLIMRKDVIARNLSYAEQLREITAVNKTMVGYQYEDESSILDLATVVCLHYACTRKRHLGDNSGVEKRLTFARGEEMVSVSRADAKNRRRICKAMVGAFSKSGLYVEFCGHVKTQEVGVALLMKL